MKIARVETLRADAGWRLFSFLKVTTDDGLIGWSEYNESFGSTGLSSVISPSASWLDVLWPSRIVPTYSLSSLMRRS